MQNNNFIFEAHEDSLYSNRIKQFCNLFNVATLLNRSRIRKAKGFAAKDIFFILFALPFYGKDLYHDVINNEVDKLHKSGKYAEDMYQSLISAIFGSAIEFFGLDRQLCQKS